MQVLTTSLFDDEIEIVIDGATSDDRARMTVMPAMYQDTIKAMVDGETDGRGIDMGPDGYTALGVAGALRRAGLEVSGDELPPPDKDGAAGQGEAQYGDCELDDIMMESPPRHVRDAVLLAPFVPTGLPSDPNDVD